MFHQTFPQEISFLLKIKVHNLPQSKNFRNSQKFPRTMCACPRLFPCLDTGLRLIDTHFATSLELGCQSVYLTRNTLYPAASISLVLKAVRPDTAPPIRQSWKLAVMRTILWAPAGIVFSDSVVPKLVESSCTGRGLAEESHTNSPSATQPSIVGTSFLSSLHSIIYYTGCYW